MAKITPARSPRPASLELPFRVSQDWLTAQLKATGMRIAASHKLSFSLDEVPQPLREQALMIEERRRTLGETAALEPVVDHLDQDDPLANLPAVLTSWSHALDALEAEAADRRKLQATQEALEQESSAAFHSAMEQWVAEHGSRRLKLAIGRGYRIAGAYARERAATEFPGFMVDVTDDAAWSNRANPSEEALDKESEALARVKALGIDLQVKIVWLTEPPKDFWADHSGFQPAEAIAVRRYLGRYDLVTLVRQQITELPF